MRMLKVKRVSVANGFKAFKGHALINFDAIREVKKYRDEQGQSVTRISYIGCGREDDVWIEETPQQLADYYLKSQAEQAKQLQGTFDEIKVQRVQPPETTKLNRPKDQERSMEFQDHDFDSVFKELPVELEKEA